jgi:oxalate decarboxylase/phosphoglucose isomerase-like protein (cupin superfamily)
MLSEIMDFTIGDNTIRMRAGDSIYFDSGIGHKTQDVGKRTIKFINIFI